METNKLNLFILLLHLFCGCESVQSSEYVTRRPEFDSEALRQKRDFYILAIKMDRLTETLENRFDSLSEQINQLGESCLKTGEEIKAQITELKHNISTGNENLEKEIKTLGLNLQKEQHLPELGPSLRSYMCGTQTNKEVRSTTPVLSDFEKFYSDYFSSSTPKKEFDSNESCEDFAENPTFIPVSQVVSRDDFGSLVLGGHDYDSSPLYICRVLYNETYVIGRTSGFGKPNECWIFDGISERSITKDYSLLQKPEKGVELFWETYENPEFCKVYRAISGGQIQDPKTYIGQSKNSTNFLIRGDRKDVVAPGYIDPSNPEFLQVTFHGEGLLVSEYNVLVCVG